MQNRFVTLSLVAVIAIILGIGIVSKQSRDPLLKEILKQQSEMLDTQDEIAKKLDTGKDSGSNLGMSATLFEVLRKQQALEQRIAKLESQAAGGARPTPQGPPPEDFSKVYDIPVAHTHIIGKKDALVTITEFVDFQCPFCARFHSPTMEVMKKNPDKVNVLIKNFPLSFHPNARPAAKAALAAGEQGKYGEMATALLENGNALSEDKYKELAKNLGLDVDKFMKDYKDKDAQWEDILNKDMSLGSDVGVQGTPTFFINGRKTNARDVDSLQTAVDQTLKEKN